MPCSEASAPIQACCRSSSRWPMWARDVRTRAAMQSSLRAPGMVNEKLKACAQLEVGTAAVARGLVAARRDVAHRVDHHQQERRVERVTFERAEGRDFPTSARCVWTDSWRTPKRATLLVTVA